MGLRAVWLEKKGVQRPQQGEVLTHQNHPDHRAGPRSALTFHRWGEKDPEREMIHSNLQFGDYKRKLLGELALIAHQIILIFFPVLKFKYSCCTILYKWGGRASLVAQMVKNLPAKAGDLCSIPGLGRSPGEGHDYPLQYSCLENPMDRAAWWATYSMGLQRVGQD